MHRGRGTLRSGPRARSHEKVVVVLVVDVAVVLELVLVLELVFVVDVDVVLFVVEEPVVLDVVLDVDVEELFVVELVFGKGRRATPTTPTPHFGRILLRSF